MTPEQLENLYSMAKEKEDKAMLQLKQAKQFKAQHQQQLESLYHYRKEYVLEFDAKRQKANNKVESRVYYNYYQFLARLDQAIEQHLAGAAEIDQHLETCQEIWQNLYMKTKAFEKLMEKRKEAQLLQQQNYEQALLDEYVTLQYSRRDRKR